MKVQSLGNDNSLERAGMIASFACAVHCALTPLVIGVVPFLGMRFLADERAEWILVGVSMAIGISTLLPAYIRRHRQAKPLLLFASGLCLILLGHLGPAAGPLTEMPMAVSGGLLVTASQLLNRRLCQSFTTCQHCH